MNVAGDMEWYCCGLVLLHYLQDRLIMIGKSYKIFSRGGGGSYRCGLNCSCVTGGMMNCLSVLE